MRPGQVAPFFATWVGVPESGVEVQGITGLEVPLSSTISMNIVSGIQRHTDGRLDPRDGLITARFLAIAKDDMTLRIEPGLSIPTGRIGSELQFTPLSTASVDPWISGDFLYGGKVLGGLSARSRVPLYQGWDRRTQGAFVRVDLRSALRLGAVVPSVGISGVRQAPANPVDSVADFTELAGVAAVNYAPHKRWSLTAQARIPAWVSEDAIQVFAGGVSVRTVLFNAADMDDKDEDEDEDEDEDDHHEGDGHAH